MKIKKNSVEIPKYDFIKEHEHLIKLLSKLGLEMKDQMKELKRVKKAGRIDDFTRVYQPPFFNTNQVVKKPLSMMKFPQSYSTL